MPAISHAGRLNTAADAISHDKRSVLFEIVPCTNSSPSTIPQTLIAFVAPDWILPIWVKKFRDSIRWHWPHQPRDPTNQPKMLYIILRRGGSISPSGLRRAAMLLYSISRQEWSCPQLHQELFISFASSADQLWLCRLLHCINFGGGGAIAYLNIWTSIVIDMPLAFSLPKNQGVGMA